MARFTKQLFGKNVEIEIVGSTRQEVIDWKNYFFNWAAIQLRAGNDLDLTPRLEAMEQEIEETPTGEYRFAFFAKKEKVIKAFKDSAEAATDWDTIKEKLGKRGREAMHKALEESALARFEAIPGGYSL